MIMGTMIRTCHLVRGGGTTLTLAGIGLAQSAGDVISLRGAGVEEPVAVEQVFQQDTQRFNRDYRQQPPLIPHQIEGYTINIRHNKCLSCHSWANYRSSRATKISQTHFESRDGAILANVSARRYFCTQCHVPQVDSAPLVENEFAPVEALKMN